MKAIMIAAIAAGLVGAAHAQQGARIANGYPERPIRVIGSSAPGSGSDTMMRRVSPQLSERLGTPVVVDNRVGAVGAIAVELAAQASPDGYTLLVLNGQSISGMLLKQITVDIPKAFTPIVQLSGQPYLIIANTSLPANSIKELIALAKSKTGTSSLSYGSSGVGGQVHIGMELLNFLAGTAMLHVPYKGSAIVVTEVMAGHVQLAMTNVLTAGPHVKGGRIKALAVTTLHRAQAFPTVPTVAESGLPGFELNNWYGMLAPAGTPLAFVNRINATAVEITNSPEMKRELAVLGVEAAPPHSPAEFRQLIAREVARWDTFLKKTPIKFE